MSLYFIRSHHANVLGITVVTDRWTDSYDKSVDYREIGDALNELVLVGISERPTPSASASVPFGSAQSAKRAMIVIS